MNTPPCRFDKANISREILAYLAEHPDAEHTLDGIVQWWLLERKGKHQANIVREILDGLVKQGLVRKHETRDSETLYQIGNVVTIKRRTV